MPYLRHVGIENVSSRLNENPSLPEWVISTKKENVIEGVEYDEVWVKSPVRVLRRRDAGWQKLTLNESK